MNLYIHVPTCIKRPRVTNSTTNSSFRVFQRCCNIIGTDLSLGGKGTKSTYSIRGSQLMQLQPNHAFPEPGYISFCSAQTSLKDRGQFLCLFYSPVVHLTSPRGWCTCSVQWCKQCQTPLRGSIVKQYTNIIMTRNAGHVQTLGVLATGDVCTLLDLAAWKRLCVVLVSLTR